MSPLAGKVAQLRIELRWLRPPIWRRVLVPADLTLRQLHGVIQAVFDWQDYHLHEFKAGGERYGQAELVDDGFDFGPTLRSDRNVRLSELVARGIRRFGYTYDFGGCWEHLVTVQRVGDPKPGTLVPVLVAAAGHAPPEDCGGPPGYEHLLAVMADEDHPEHAELTGWAGGRIDPNHVDVEAIRARLTRIGTDLRKGQRKGTRPKRGA